MPIYEHCLTRKATRLPFGKAKRTIIPLQLIHFDICGPMNVRAHRGAHYFITFIDDFTRYGHIYLISYKFEALKCFKRYSRLVENKLNVNIKALETDRGREYLYDLFKNYCDDKGIARQLTIPLTPQQNGVAKRRNITLLDMVRSMIMQTNFLISFWGDALLFTAFIINRVPSTPYELWKGKIPDLSIMRPWGCAAYIHNTSQEYEKLGLRGKKCIFIRYSDIFKGYVFLGEDMIGRVTEFESRDVIFLEEDFPKRGEINGDFRLYKTEDPEGSGSIRHINLDPTKQDSMGYRAPHDVSGSEKLSDLIIWNRIINNLNLDEVIMRKFPVVGLRLRGKPS